MATTSAEALRSRRHTRTTRTIVIGWIRCMMCATISVFNSESPRAGFFGGVPSGVDIRHLLKAVAVVDERTIPSRDTLLATSGSLLLEPLLIVCLVFQYSPEECLPHSQHAPMIPQPATSFGGHALNIPHSSLSLNGEMINFRPTNYQKGPKLNLFLPYARLQPPLALWIL